MFSIEKWENWFLDLAKVVSKKSKDPSTKVGAVIADPKNRFISLGYNGYPRGIKDEGLDNREEKYAKVIHAEINAILFAKRDLTDCTLYVYPLAPCSNCMSVIIQSGITRIIALANTTDIDSIKRWELSNQIGLKMAKEANVKVIIRTP